MNIGHKHKKIDPLPDIWRRELRDIVRGLCGGFLFGIPLLYTMEVWWIGSTASHEMMVVGLSITFVVVFFLNRTEGFRRSHRRPHPYDAIADTVEAMAIGLTCAFFLLLLLQELTLQTQLTGTLGKIIFESVPFSIGVGLTNQFLSDSPSEEPSGSKPNSSEEALHATLADIGATLIGAMVIAFNIAPTDEVPTLAAATSEPWLVAIALLSLLISYGIVFEAGFLNQQKRIQQKGIFQRPTSETIMSYLVSLAASAFMLWFFHRLTLTDPWELWLRYTLILGLPATVGGAAGRLAI
jgi:putative integral membrane protein (TIGR02587 family)